MIASVVYPCCHKILPLTYANSLSYMEEIDHLIAKVNEVIEAFNADEDIIKQLAQQIVDIDSLKVNVNLLQTEVEALKTKMNNADNALDALSRRDNQLQGEIDGLTNTINGIINQFDYVYAYVDRAVESAKLNNQQEWIRFQVSVNASLSQMNVQIKELTELVQKIGNDVYNPIRAVRESLDRNNADVYGDLRYGGITNAELSEFGVSNDYIASIVHDNRDYALHARKRLKLHYLFSPVSGKKVSHANAISQAIVAVIGAITNNNMTVTTNEMLYDYMSANNLTNENIGDIIVDNFSRYVVSVQEGV